MGCARIGACRCQVGLGRSEYRLCENMCEEYVSQTSHSLKLRYKEHEHYIKHNNLQSAYALHILNNKHEYGPIDKTMTLLTPVKSTTLLLPYELFFMQSPT